jgi:hypothetical protein
MMATFVLLVILFVESLFPRNHTATHGSQGSIHPVVARASALSFFAPVGTLSVCIADLGLTEPLISVIFEPHIPSSNLKLGVTRGTIMTLLVDL